jgi:hypothetical protein
MNAKHQPERRPTSGKGQKYFTESRKHFTDLIVNILDEINLNAKYFDVSGT